MTPNKIVDAVFVVGTGSKNNNEELKYALRNLDKNCPFIRNVYISGECPAWVDTTKVKHLPWPDRFKHAKDANIIDKLVHACEQPEIAENILFCSDDQFQTRVCSWEDFRPRYLRQYTPEDPWYASKNRIWHNRLRATLERERARRKELGLDINSIYYYQPHIWMPLNKNKFLEYAKWSKYETREDTIIASGYYNFIEAKGEPNFDHIFIPSLQEWPTRECHIGYGDYSFAAAMRYLRKEFPSKSYFEKEGAAERRKEEIPDVTSRAEPHPPVKNPPVENPPPPGPKCSKCEERRRRKEQERLAREQAAEQATEQAAAPEVSNTADFSCIDCAIDHLATAAAYLNSNAARPSYVDSVLAQGELRVAAQHLLALNKNEEYNICLEILDSVNTENSLLTGKNIKNLVVQLTGNQ